MALLVDISRLIENLHLATPTGIDRVEMAYAQHFLQRANEDDVRFVVTWPRFSGVLHAQDIKPLIDETAARWTAAKVIRSDQSFQTLRAILNEPIDSGRQRPQRIGAPDANRKLSDWRRVVSLWLRCAAHRLDARSIAELRNKGGCYIHVSQFRLNRPARFAWLSEASMRSIFFNAPTKTMSASS